MKKFDYKPPEKVLEKVCASYFVAFTKTFTVSFYTEAIHKLCCFKPKTLKIL